MGIDNAILMTDYGCIMRSVSEQELMLATVETVVLEILRRCHAMPRGSDKRRVIHYHKYQ